MESKDNWTSHWNAFAKSASDNPAQKLRHNILLDYLANITPKPKLLIDIGSGQGDFLQQTVLRSLAERLIGFELSETGVVLSREKVPTAEFYRVDLYSPPLALKTFSGCADVVVCSDVIEHVDDPKGFCRLILGYLKPGGTLLLTVPGGPMSAFDQHIGHRTHFTRDSITNLLLQSGFEVGCVNMAGFPFFNLYRLVVIMRGRRLIKDIEIREDGSPNSFLARLFLWIFRFLFHFNLKNSCLGWQVVAIARRPH